MSACPPLEALVDYWIGDGDDADAAALEDHQWSCAACTRRLGWIARLDEASRALMRRGALNLPLTAALADRLAADGVRLRTYKATPNQDVACTIALDDDLVVSWFDAPAHDDERVAVEVRGPDGSLLDAIDDVPVDRATGSIILASSGDVIRRLPDITVRWHLSAVGPSGSRPLGDYVYHHTAPRP